MEILVKQVKDLPDPLDITETDEFFEGLENGEVEFQEEYGRWNGDSGNE